LTSFERATARWARFVVGLCTTTGGSSLEPVLVDDVPPAVCAKLSALQMLKTIPLTAPRHTSLGHPFESPTEYFPKFQTLLGALSSSSMLRLILELLEIQALLERI
jgi:hypothetical protein